MSEFKVIDWHNLDSVAVFHMPEWLYDLLQKNKFNFKEVKYTNCTQQLASILSVNDLFFYYGRVMFDGHVHNAIGDYAFLNALIPDCHYTDFDIHATEFHVRRKKIERELGSEKAAVYYMQHDEPGLDIDPLKAEMSFDIKQHEEVFIITSKSVKRGAANKQEEFRKILNTLNTVVPTNTLIKTELFHNYVMA